jgi:thiamine-phosphate pyrophosphorylase
MRVDLRLYAIVDPEQAGGRALPELARSVAEGGATLVQLRAKHSGTREMIAQARAIKAALEPLTIPFVVNDRVDVALASGADGVHLGQEDMDVADARRLLGREAIIGWSVKTMAEAQTAPLQHLTYVAIGAVFPTTSKENPSHIGPEGLRKIAAEIRARAPGFPVGAIAGINEANAAEVIAAGADGICAISALSSSPAPAAAAKKLRGIVDTALAKGGPR